MRIAIIGILITGSALGQSVQNVRQSGNLVPPNATFASPPSSPATGAEFTFTDATTAGTCSGGGIALAKCRWSGSAWQSIGGSGGGSIPATTNALAGNGSGGASAVTGSGTNCVLVNGTSAACGGGGSITCDTQSVPYTSLTAAGAVTNTEIAISTLVGVAGTTRYDDVTLSETTQFTGTSVTGLTVSMGRTGSNASEMSGGTFPLMVSSGDANFDPFRPAPPVVAPASTYSPILKFVEVGGTGLNALTAGTLTLRVCHY